MRERKHLSRLFIIFQTQDGVSKKTHENYFNVAFESSDRKPIQSHISNTIFHRSVQSYLMGHF
jgi:hypothetical protein